MARKLVAPNVPGFARHIVRRGPMLGNMSSEAPPMIKPEVLAPAGSPEALQAAIHAGADAIYLGVTD